MEIEMPLANFASAYSDNRNDKIGMEYITYAIKYMLNWTLFQIWVKNCKKNWIIANETLLLKY